MKVALASFAALVVGFAVGQSWPDSDSAAPETIHREADCSTIVQRLAELRSDLQAVLKRLESAEPIQRSSEETALVQAPRAPAVIGPLLPADEERLVVIVAKAVRLVRIEEEKAPLMRRLRTRLRSARDTLSEYEAESGVGPDVQGARAYIEKLSGYLEAAKRVRTTEELEELIRESGNGDLLD